MVGHSLPLLQQLRFLMALESAGRALWPLRPIRMNLRRLRILLEDLGLSPNRWRIESEDGYHACIQSLSCVDTETNRYLFYRFFFCCLSFFRRLGRVQERLRILLMGNHSLTIGSLCRRFQASIPCRLVAVCPCNRCRVGCLCSYTSRSKGFCNAQPIFPCMLL